MYLLWVGGPTTRIEIGSFRLLTDPAFGEGPEAFVFHRHPSTGEYAHVARLAPLPAVDTDDLDIVIASHLHADHFDPSAVQRLDKGLELVAPTANLPQLREWGFDRAAGMEWQEEMVWHKDGERLRVVALPAYHAHNDEANHDLGVVNGYLIEHQDGDAAFRIYWTGDTVWFDALAETAARLPKVDLMLPHMGAAGKDGGPWGMVSLDAVEGTRMAEVIDPATIIPIHHSTFSFYVEPIGELEEKLRNSTYGGRLVILREGETWTGGRARADTLVQR
jgi:N-acyl-phosphatidylethanolamine-hydrolysing phospholipase D